MIQPDEKKVYNFDLEKAARRPTNPEDTDALELENWATTLLLRITQNPMSGYTSDTSTSFGWPKTIAAAARQREKSSYTENMSTPTREEFQARLESIEHKMDGRVASIEGKIETLLVTFNERDKATAERFGRIESELSGIRSESKNFKWWLIGLIVPTAIATVVAVASLNGTILGSMLASFESGKSTSAVQAQVIQQVKDTQALLDEAKKTLAHPPRADNH